MDGEKKMKVKTFVGTCTNDIDEKVNAFEEENDVRATQTRTVVKGTDIIHFYTVFYNEKK